MRHYSYWKIVYNHWLIRKKLFNWERELYYMKLLIAGMATVGEKKLEPPKGANNRIMEGTIAPNRSDSTLSLSCEKAG